MPRFRPRITSLADAARGLIADAVRPEHFFVGPVTHLEWDYAGCEKVVWEVFRGRLLDPAHTRQRRTFEAWNIYLIENGVRSPEPLLSVKSDRAAGQIHVVRAIHCYAWEGYDAGGNVILSRETKKWVRELVGTIDLADYTDADDLRDEIICRLFQAVVGTSRLPLTSVEAPLPAFTFGELGYFYHSPTLNAGPMRTWQDLMTLDWYSLSWGEVQKLVELSLRAVPSEERAALAASLRHPHDFTLPLLHSLFNGVSLSPYTGFVETIIAVSRQLAASFRLLGWHADFAARLLRQIGRHLTAYDLVRFHHAGANYPDALLLDAVLRECFDLIERRPDLHFDASEDDERTRKAKRLRRRGVRQGWLVRQRYRGHPIPDAPTSPGENARVLPMPHARVPEEQILHPHRRTKQLFVEDAPGGALSESARAVLRASVADLTHPDELRELGMALYLDRPLGALKAPGEPDQTPMLSYTAFSRMIATQRLLLLGRDQNLLNADELARHREALQSLPVVGLPLSEITGAARPGAVSIADARKAADDFVFLRTTAQATRAFFDLFDFRPCLERLSLTWEAPLLIVGGTARGASGEILLTIYEAGTLHKRLELSANTRDGYICRAGVEYPRQGLRVRRVWVEVGGAWREHDLRAEQLFVRPLG
jgi:hypothetical protein